MKMIEKAWNWEKINNSYWDEPADEIYYYLYNWGKNHSRKLLDLGCGKGRHSIIFAKNGFEVTAFDLSEEGLYLLSKKAQNLNLDISTVEGNMNRLPFSSQCFDFILAYNSIYHTDFEGLIRTIYEMKRVLKNGGEAYVTMLSKNDLSYKNNLKNLISENTLVKKEEDGSFLPHFFVNCEKIYELFKCFKIMSVKQIEEFHDEKSFFHYNIHLKKES